MTPALGARYQSSWGIPSTFEQMAKISLNYINFFELTKLRKVLYLHALVYLKDILGNNQMEEIHRAGCAGVGSAGSFHHTLSGCPILPAPQCVHQPRSSPTPICCEGFYAGTIT